jgi:hypothetical protein
MKQNITLPPFYLSYYNIDTSTLLSNTCGDEKRKEAFNVVNPIPMNPSLCGQQHEKVGPDLLTLFTFTS